MAVTFACNKQSINSGGCKHRLDEWTIRGVNQQYLYKTHVPSNTIKYIWIKISLKLLNVNQITCYQHLHSKATLKKNILSNRILPQNKHDKNERQMQIQTSASISPSPPWQQPSKQWICPACHATKDVVNTLAGPGRDELISGAGNSQVWLKSALGEFF